MINILNYFIAILLLLAVSCKKGSEIPEEQNPYWGTVTVDKNGVPWTALPSVSISPKFKDKLNFNFTQVDELGFKREKCGIIKVPAQEGAYPLSNTSIQVDDGLVGSNYFFNDYDLLLGYYDVLEADSSSFVTITSYDTLTREVKGAFEATFIVRQRPYSGAPDTIRLRNGIFHTKVL